MADYVRREVQPPVRVEYVLRSPTNWVEVEKALRGLRNEPEHKGATWDDSVTVEARDDEIVFWFERPDPKRGVSGG